MCNLSESLSQGYVRVGGWIEGKAWESNQLIFIYQAKKKPGTVQSIKKPAVMVRIICFVLVPPAYPRCSDCRSDGLRESSELNIL